MNKVIASNFLLDKKKLLSNTHVYIHILFYLDYFIKCNKLNSHINIQIALKNYIINRKVSELFIYDKRKQVLCIILIICVHCLIY
jgi:hypothetical protein